jgi:Periplasmic component of the Tol biopolymer transport system
MGEREITGKSDVYALGCVLYEMLVGEPPFTGPTVQAVVARVMTEEPRSLTIQRKTIPPHVEASVRKALQKLSADRFASPAAFADALVHPESMALPTSAGMPAAFSASSVAWKRRFVIAAALGTLATVVAVLAWIRSARIGSAGPDWSYLNFGDSLQVQTNLPALAYSPDGSTIVIKSDVQNGRLWLKRRADLHPTSIPGTERATSPVFSPDGKWIAFIRDGQVRKVGVDGGGAVTLADTAFNLALAWLDDGSLIYSPTLFKLRRISSAGGPSTVVLEDSTLFGLAPSGFAPLPGGRGILLTSCNAGCVSMTLLVLDLKTRTQHTLLPDVAQGWYLPGGRLLYVRRDGTAMVAPFDLDKLQITGAAVPVLEGVLVSVGFAQLAWSPSGSLLYVRGEGLSPDQLLFRVTRDGAVAPLDTSWVAQFTSPVVSRDGRRIAVGVGGTVSALNIWVRSMDRGPATRLTFGGQDRRPAWSPDGRLIAFVRDTAAGSVVMARPADGAGSDRLLARLDRIVQEVAWSPDGQWLVLRTDNGAAGAGDLVGVRTRRGHHSSVPCREPVHRAPPRRLTRRPLAGVLLQRVGAQ